MPAPERILLIRPSALGDVARTVPLVATLRRAYPHARIDWLVQDAFADVVRGHPGISSVVEFPRNLFRGPLGAPRFLKWLPALRAGRYDLVLDAQGLARSGAMALATGAGRRIGHADAREGAALAYTDRVRPGAAVHTVDRMLTLTGALGLEPVVDLQLWTPEDAPELPEALGGGGGGAVRYAVVAPTSRWAAKRWPAERFGAVCEALLVDGALDAVAIVGGGAERDQCAALLERAGRDRRIVDLVGATTVGQLMRVIEGAAVVIANDSAALHIAVGLGRPIVGLYGPTRVERVGPYGREGDVLQRIEPGDDLSHKRAGNVRLMERISVDEVVEAARGRVGVGERPRGA